MDFDKRALNLKDKVQKDLTSKKKKKKGSKNKRVAFILLLSVFCSSHFSHHLYICDALHSLLVCDFQFNVCIKHPFPSYLIYSPPDQFPLLSSSSSCTSSSPRGHATLLGVLIAVLKNSQLRLGGLVEADGSELQGETVESRTPRHVGALRELALCSQALRFLHFCPHYYTSCFEFNEVELNIDAKYFLAASSES